MSVEGRAGVEHRLVTVDESQPAQACCKCVWKLDASGNMMLMKNFENFQILERFSGDDAVRISLKNYVVCRARESLNGPRLLRNVHFADFRCRKVTWSKTQILVKADEETWCYQLLGGSGLQSASSEQAIYRLSMFCEKLNFFDGKSC